MEEKKHHFIRYTSPSKVVYNNHNHDYYYQHIQDSIYVLIVNR